MSCWPCLCLGSCSLSSGIFLGDPVQLQLGEEWFLASPDFSLVGFNKKAMSP